MANLPVFVSVPSKLNRQQQAVHRAIETELQILHFEPRTVGRSDHALQSPLGEVYQLARRCCGGLILGFRQASTKSATLWAGTKVEQANVPAYWPSAWNQLEAGVLYTLGMPILVFAEDGVNGGIFDPGVANIFIHQFSCEKFDAQERARLGMLLQEWARHARNFYTDDPSPQWRR
jgi:hypothetical protein